MPKYKPIYKCRLCGAVYGARIVTEDKDAAEQLMFEMVAGICTTHPLPVPRKLRTHECGGRFRGSLGLADFQGWQAVPDPTAEDKTESGLLEE